MPPRRLYNQLTLAETTQVHAELLASSSLPAARHHAARLFADHPSLAIGITFERPQWRVRRSPGPDGYSSLLDLLAPPGAGVRRGRLNHDHDPRLYLARQLETAIAEMEPIQGEHFHAIALLSNAKAELRLAVVGEQHHVVRRGYLEHFGYDPNETIKRELSSQGPQLAERIAYADALMGDILADVDARERDYIPSRALGDLIRQGTNQVHGIVYPSVRHHLGTNYCIDPEPAQKLLKVVASFVVRVDRIWKKGYFSLLRTATSVLQANGQLRRVAAKGRHPIRFNLEPSEVARFELQETSSAAE